MCIRDRDRNIIYKGVFNELDEKVVRWHEANDTLECIRKYLNNFLLKYETDKRKVAPTKNTNDYVKIHETEKSGCTLQLTQKRAKTITEEFAKANIKGEVELTYKSSYDETKENIVKLNIDELQFLTATGTNKNVMGSQLQGIYKSITATKTKMIDEVVMQYKNFIRAVSYTHLTLPTKA